MKKFRVLKAFQNYSVGDVIEPEGIWRGNLLADGLIEEVRDTSEQPPTEFPQPQPKRKYTRKDVVHESL